MKSEKQKALKSLRKAENGVALNGLLHNPRIKLPYVAVALEAVFLCHVIQLWLNYFVFNNELKSGYR